MAYLIPGTHKVTNDPTLLESYMSCHVVQTALCHPKFYTHFLPAIDICQPYTLEHLCVSE